LPENGGAPFQVASQLKMLEMVGPDVTPEDGAPGYVHDRTQRADASGKRRSRPIEKGWSQHGFRDAT
jgi:hypothetical protein